MVESDSARISFSKTMSSIDFDEVLLHVGEKGRYQNLMYYLLCIPATLPAAFLAFSQVITNHENN